MIDLCIGRPSGDHIRIALPAPNGEGWLDADVSIRAAGFLGAARPSFEVDDFARFLTEVRKLYDGLSGRAKFEPREGQLTMELEGNGRGRIVARGSLYSYATYGSRLVFEFELDQTFLPPVVRVLAEFVALAARGA